MGEKVWAGYMSTLDKKTRKASEERRKRGESPFSFCVLLLCRSRRSREATLTVVRGASKPICSFEWSILTIWKMRERPPMRSSQNWA